MLSDLQIEKLEEKHLHLSDQFDSGLFFDAKSFAKEVYTLALEDAANVCYDTTSCYDVAMDAISLCAESILKLKQESKNVT